MIHSEIFTIIITTIHAYVLKKRWMRVYNYRCTCCNVQIVTISHGLTMFPSPAELRRNRSTHETPNGWLWLHKCPIIPVFYILELTIIHSDHVSYILFNVYQWLLDKHIPLRDMNQLFIGSDFRKFPRWSQALDTDACNRNIFFVDFWGQKVKRAFGVLLI